MDCMLLGFFLFWSFHIDSSLRGESNLPINSTYSSLSHNYPTSNFQIGVNPRSATSTKNFLSQPFNFFYVLIGGDSDCCIKKLSVLILYIYDFRAFLVCSFFFEESMLFEWCVCKFSSIFVLRETLLVVSKQVVARQLCWPPSHLSWPASFGGSSSAVQGHSLDLEAPPSAPVFR